jgi:HK97 family phage prohead protease
MLLGGPIGDLELRAARNGSRRLRGKFPYNKTAVLSDGGRTGAPQKEVFAPHAFEYRINDPKANIHLLVGHSYDRPLASVSAGTLTLKDTAEAVTFEATITEELLAAQWVQDFLAMLSAGLIVGLSPGFRLPPERAVKVAEKITKEKVDPSAGAYGATIRTVLSALLFEMSVVTVPAYPDTTVEERAQHLSPEPAGAALREILNRWRA